jgi:hypothetical protein
MRRHDNGVLHSALARLRNTLLNSTRMHLDHQQWLSKHPAVVTVADIQSNGHS